MRHSRCRAGLERLQFGVVARQANVLRRPQPTNWQFTTLRPSRYRSSEKVRKDATTSFAPSTTPA
jgi:hypothetical protein